MMTSNSAALLISINNRMQLENIINATLLDHDEDNALAGILDDELSQLL